MAKKEEMGKEDSEEDSAARTCHPIDSYYAQRGTLLLTWLVRRPQTNNSPKSCLAGCIPSEGLAGHMGSHVRQHAHQADQNQSGEKGDTPIETLATSSRHGLREVAWLLGKPSVEIYPNLETSSGKASIFGM